MILGGLERGLGGLRPHFSGLGASLLVMLADWIRHPDALAGLAGWLGWLAEEPRIQGTLSGEGDKPINLFRGPINHQTAGCRLQAAI